MQEFIEVKDSPIAGKGVFAKKHIPKGQTIHFMGGELCSLDEIIQRVKDGLEESSDPLGIGVEEYIDLDELSRSFNHACNPKTYIKGKNEMIALVDIAPGEEITFDYSTTMDVNEEKILAAGLPLWTCPCACGSKDCRGIIDQFKSLPTDAQAFYINNRFMPDFMLKRFA